MAEMLSDFGHIIGLNGSTQVAVMPTYSTVATGTIVQYVGATDANYTNGYFYKATTSGWEVVDVQGEDTDKADKVASATAGNLAGLNASGNLTDAGWSADKITSNASGNPISISGLKSNQLAINPVVTLEPIQAGSGDPSPSNVRAISGYDKIEVLSCGNGENQLNYNAWKDVTVLRGTAVFENNGVTLTATGDDCLTGFYYPEQWGQGFPEDAIVSVSEGDVVLLTWEENTNANGYAFIFGNGYTNSMVAINNHDAKALSYVVPSGITYVTFRFSVSNSGVTISFKNIHISVQKPNTNIQLQLGQTIYGATWHPETGVLTVDRAGVDLGNLNYTYNSDSAYFLSTNLTDIAPASISWRHNNITCSCYKQASDWSDLSGNTGINNIIDADDMQVILRDTRYTDVTSFKTAIAGQTLVYKLATPFTIQLTPHEISLLKNYAYVSTNGTNISLDYHNGEIASLGDVESLGKTMNLLGNEMSKSFKYLKVSQHTFSSAGGDYLLQSQNYGVPFSSRPLTKWATPPSFFLSNGYWYAHYFGDVEQNYEIYWITEIQK